MLIFANVNPDVLPFDEAVRVGVTTALQGMGIVFVVLAVLTLLVRLVSVLCSPRTKKAAITEERAAHSEPKVQTHSLANTDDNLIVDGVEDAGTAAVIMAVVAYNTGSDVNRLKFKSIKLLEE